MIFSRNNFGYGALVYVAAICLLIGCAQLKATAKPAQFIAVSPEKTASIVLQYDAASQSGVDWESVKVLPYYSRDDKMVVRNAVEYLQEAVQKMTEKELPVQSGNDLSRGIVLTLFKNAPDDIKNDDAVKAALRNTGNDNYNANEAFYIRSEASRILIVANTWDGFNSAIVALLESVDYEVLGMGSNWIHVPDYHQKPLVFAIEKADRPGFYIRNLWATSGQQRGVGTLTKVTDPQDEPVGQSYERWLVGTRMAGESMPGFPGHAMQGYHNEVLQKMRETGSTEGFLVKKTLLGLDAKRPAASEENKGDLWINTDSAGDAAKKTYISDGKEWKQDRVGYVHASLDLSSPLVRGVILEALQQRSQKYFQEHPDKAFIFPVDPEDGGGYANMGELLSHPNWYPEYLKSEGITFGQPYVLNGFKGLDHPVETWDPQLQSNTVFGFDNWLLREYDKWIDSLPAAERITATGDSKKSLVRTSLYCYNYHDVPADFNLDPRIRVMIASYPKHRGRGKWKNFKTHTDMAQAYQIMLPREPSGNYLIISLAYYRDSSTGNIRGSHLPSSILQRIREMYDSGFRALSCETDFNFGKQGLEYYLYSKVLWNPQISLSELESLRDRWLQRSFGSGWQDMKAYYDFMAPENYTLNAPNNWAKAIRMIDAADQKIDGIKEPDAQRRIDDVKQFWYFYYLTESGQTEPPKAALKEFAWKGQMSYMTAMHMVIRRFFKTNKAADAAGAAFNTGPAHYTHAETQAWWEKVLSFWKLTPVHNFADATLANGQKGKAVDVNDLVPVTAFEKALPLQPYIYNSAQIQSTPFITVARNAGDVIGCKLLWPWLPDYSFNNYERDVSYGISIWDTEEKQWEELVDKTMTTVANIPATDAKGKELRVAEVKLIAPQAGTYRIDLGPAGNLAQLATLSYDLQTGEDAGNDGLTFDNTLKGLTQRPVYFYIPKGTKSIDLEVWRSFGRTQLTLHTGLPATEMKKTRTVDITTIGAHTVALEPGEDGSLATIGGNGFAFPYMYSVPMLWAKSPSQLLVPRAIAEADGLVVGN